MMEFIDTVTGVIYAVVAFGILIFFHELGHFLMAKLVGVRVLTFAMGFGTKLLKLSWRGTEYAICAFPLGGYVKMVGEDPDEEIAPEDRSRSFDAQSVSKRMLITVAGVTFNLMLAVTIVSIIHWGEVSFYTARVNEVLEGYPAAEAGLMPGDLIVSIDGDPVYRANELRERIMSNDGARVLVGYQRDVEGLIRRPVHKRVYGIAMYVGVALLACIMAWALYRDADRIQYWMNEQSERPEVEAIQAPVEEPEKP
jgi:regulator of sigma E protease